MSKVFGIFQIGPVQEFITCAKKTQDFWSGSFMLSYLCSVAIATIKKHIPDSIIYPDVTTDPLFGVVKGNPDNPDAHNFTPLSNAFYGTIPNRFIVLLDEKNAEKIFNTARDNVVKTYEKMWNKAKETIESVSSFLKSDTKWNSIWNRQTEKVFEIYWTVSDISDPNKFEAYSKEYISAEGFFGARKTIRNFEQTEGEPGFKCTICGIREQLTKTGMDTSSQKYKNFWKQLNQSLYAPSLKYTFREEERLCAVCTTKRLAPMCYFKINTSFPSTSSMAVAPVLFYLAKGSKDTKTKSILQRKIKDFEDCFKKLRLDLFPDSLRPIPAVEKIISPGMGKIFNWDGDAFIMDTYQPKTLAKYRKDKSEPNSNEIKETRKALKSLLDEVKEVPPAKYYAVLMVDGDDMGKWLSGEKAEINLTKHREISKRLGEFSRKFIPSVAENDPRHRARVVYFGGDEGLVFVSLEDLFSLMRHIRAGYSGQVKFVKGQFQADFTLDPQEEIKDNSGNTQFITMGDGATLSIGAVIAHHQQSLLQVLEEVRNALREAKKVLDKDSFCISLMKRSGGALRVSSKWVSADGFDVLRNLEEMAKHYREEIISDRWLNDMEREKDGLERLPLWACNAEICRILKRHSREKEKIDILFRDNIQSLSKLMKTYSVDNNYLDSFIKLHYITAYIAKGGGH